ncbi:hypothetical protein Q8A67_007422 [Cirrhinus molitorella]|uniref:Uncharacterized protein n=1 Tax=Cirrhinus molitorella TaxID=172907 RepID=A0AA88TQS6_9TELE|nr:hypothetical protein Q8A67_007422 [Cirrhinus molitorella]
MLGAFNSDRTTVGVDESTKSYKQTGVTEYLSEYFAKLFGFPQTLTPVIGPAGVGRSVKPSSCTTAE